MSFGRKPATRSAPPARKPAAAAAPQSSGGGMMSGMMGTMAQGLAFGAGSAVAHQAVGAAVGSMSGGGGGGEEVAQNDGQLYAQQQQMSNEACGIDKQNFFECLKMNNGDGASCQFLYDAMKSCQTGGAPAQQQWA